MNADFDNQVFPSYLISTAMNQTEQDSDEQSNVIGDPDSQLGIWITGAEKGASYTLTLRKSELWEESTVSGTLPDSDDEFIFIAPKVNYLYDKLRDAGQMRPITAIFDLTLDDTEMGSKSATLNVHSINDCPYGVASSEEELDAEENPPEGETAEGETAEGDAEEESSGGTYTDLGWMFAAYVNESHPMLDKLLKTALESGIVDSFDDYQSSDKGAVYAQIYALWDTLHERGIHYSNAVTTPEGSELVYSQNVRFIEQSFNNHQANCVDGSVLMASLLRKIGLRPFLVSVPGHMYLGVYLDEDRKEFIGIETTLIGVADVDAGAQIPELRSALSEDLLENPSLLSFEAAVECATADLKKNSAKFEGDDPTYQLIDIQTARDDGVMPISFKK